MKSRGQHGGGRSKFVTAPHNFGFPGLKLPIRILRNVDTIIPDVLQDWESSYAQVAEVNLSIMSLEKLDHIIHEMNTVKISTQQVQCQQQQCDKLYDTMDTMWYKLNNAYPD